jgi:phosphatidate cytidylyltransferase
METVTSRPAALAKRALSTVVLLPIFVWAVVYAPAWVFVLLVCAVAGLGQWEFLEMFRRSGVPIRPTVAIVGGVAVTASFGVPGLPPVGSAVATTGSVPALAPIALTLAVLGVLASVLPVRGGPPLAWQPAAIGVAGVVYVNWLIGHALSLRQLPAGLDWVLLLVWVTWVGETTAYAVGSTVGSHKLAPTISPGKTIEGAVGQLVISPIAALVVQPWFGPALGTLEAIAIGLVLGVVGQVGDLVESALKRSVGTKDTGRVIPGHGGVLDRIDGLLFNTPVLFYYVACTRGGAA